MRVLLDWKRLLLGYHDLGLSAFGLCGAVVVVPLLRMLDAGGTVHAFLVGRHAPPWGGFEVRRRAIESGRAALQAVGLGRSRRPGSATVSAQGSTRQRPWIRYSAPLPDS